MSKKRFFSCFDASPDRVKSLGDFGPSCTQPDESLTIQEILVRVSQGLTTGVGASLNDADYDDEDDHDWEDPTRQPGFDRLDALEYQNSEKAEKTRQEARKRKKDSDEKAKNDAFQKAVDEEIQRRQKKEEPQE